MRRIAIAMSKGGVGKTSTTVNLACALVALGKRVLIVDGDTQGQVSQFLGVTPAAGLYEFMTESLSQKECVTVARPNLFVLAGGLNLLKLRSWLGEQTSLSVRQKLQPDPGRIDFVLYDTAPGLDALAANILAAVDEILIPVPLQGAVMGGLAMFLDLYKSTKKHNKKLELKYMVPTMYNSRTNLHRSLLSQMIDAYGNLVTNPIPHSIRMAESVMFGKSILEYEKKNPCSAGFISLAEKVLNA